MISQISFLCMLYKYVFLLYILPNIMNFFIQLQCKNILVMFLGFSFYKLPSVIYYLSLSLIKIVYLDMKSGSKLIFMMCYRKRKVEREGRRNLQGKTKIKRWAFVDVLLILYPLGYMIENIRLVLASVCDENFVNFCILSVRSLWVTILFLTLFWNLKYSEHLVLSLVLIPELGHVHLQVSERKNGEVVWLPST